MLSSWGGGCLITRPHGVQEPMRFWAQGDGGAYAGPQPTPLETHPPWGHQGSRGEAPWEGTSGSLGGDFMPSAASLAQPCPCGSLSV